MKKKQWLIIAIAVWITFLTRPVYATICTPEKEANIAGTSIQAVAEPIYSFTAPPNATIIYPDTEVVIVSCKRGMAYSNGYPRKNDKDKRLRFKTTL